MNIEMSKKTCYIEHRVYYKQVKSMRTIATIYHPISLMSRSAVNLSISLYQDKKYDLPEFKLELIKRNSVKRI